MVRVSRIIAALALACTAATASAQSFNQEWQRWRFAQFECRQAFERQVAEDCDERCRGNAAQRQTRCLAAADRRYERALGRVMRERR